MGRYLDLARSVLPVANMSGEPKPTQRPATTAEQRLPDLRDILPPVSWLTKDQRRLWRERTEAYMAEGMNRPNAETEAMAELVMTGKLFDLSKCSEWPWDAIRLV
jgi:hypothetical protein